jgi:hypothetical protein
VILLFVLVDINQESTVIVVELHERVSIEIKLHCNYLNLYLYPFYCVEVCCIHE